MNVELKKSAASRSLGRGLFILVEFSHSQFTQTHRFINNTESLTIEGDTFTSMPFAFIQNTQGESGGSSIALPNVDRQIAQEIRLATTNESIVCRVWLCHIEKVGEILNAQRYDRGTFEVFNPNITTESSIMNLNLRLSIEFNASTMRYNPSVFKNLYL